MRGSTSTKTYLYGKTRAAVAEKLTKAMADRNGGLIFDAGNLTAVEYLDRWLSDSVRGTVRPSTFERHEGIIRLTSSRLWSVSGSGNSPQYTYAGYTARSWMPASPLPRFA
jgi:hypothetical protein